MAKHDFNITRRKYGTELTVSNAYLEIYIGDVDLSNNKPLYSKDQKKERIFIIAKIIKDALNKYNPYKTTNIICEYLDKHEDFLSELKGRERRIHAEFNDLARQKIIEYAKEKYNTDNIFQRLEYVNYYASKEFKKQLTKGD